MAVKRINRAIELLEQDQAIYYTGAHTGHVLAHAQGKEDAPTWADTSISAWSMAHSTWRDLPNTCAGLATSGRRAPAIARLP